MSAAGLADAEAIRRLIPHAGSMCLLDAVLECSASHIVCRASSHRDPGNPLAVAGRLSALHLAEYGAQAMAVHGGLAAEADGLAGAARPGVLAAVRELQLQVDELHEINSALVITATRITRSAAGSNYSFTVHADGQELAQGRVLVMTS